MNNRHFSPALYDSLRAGGQAQKFGIEAVRTGGSIFGAATAWVKDRDGKAEEYETLEAAQAEAERLNRAIVSPHVYYVAKPC